MHQCPQIFDSDIDGGPRPGLASGMCNVLVTGTFAAIQQEPCGASFSCRRVFSLLSSGDHASVRGGPSRACVIPKPGDVRTDPCSSV
jgi:hypothetical protein